jgi:hypothetical protein
MFKGKTTTLFWCGLFVLIVGIFSLCNDVYLLLNINWRFIGSNFIFWSIIDIILIVTGLYIMKSGVKKETKQNPS